MATAAFFLDFDSGAKTAGSLCWRAFQRVNIQSAIEEKIAGLIEMAGVQFHAPAENDFLACFCTEPGLFFWKCNKVCTPIMYYVRCAVIARQFAKVEISGADVANFARPLPLTTITIFCSSS